MARKVPLDRRKSRRPKNPNIEVRIVTDKSGQEAVDHYTVRDAVLKGPYRYNWEMGPDAIHINTYLLHKDVATERRIAIGSISAHLNGESANIHCVATQRGFMNGMGNGKLMVESMHNALLGRGVKEVTLTSRQGSRPFYKRMGYEDVGELTQHQDGIPRVKMRRSL